MSQYNSQEFALKMGPIFFYFEYFSKISREMILFLLVTCSYTPIPHKNAEKPTVIWFFTQNFFKSTVPSLSDRAENLQKEQLCKLTSGQS